MAREWTPARWSALATAVVVAVAIAIAALLAAAGGGDEDRAGDAPATEPTTTRSSSDAGPDPTDGGSTSGTGGPATTDGGSTGGTSSPTDAPGEGADGGTGPGSASGSGSSGTGSSGTGSGSSGTGSSGTGSSPTAPPPPAVPVTPTTTPGAATPTTRPTTTTTRPTTPTTRPTTTTTRPTTSTTAPNQTTTTTTTTTSTTPTAEPPGPDPAGRAAAGWRFVPASVLLEPGESTVARLVHADPQGVDTGGRPPESLGLQVTEDGVVRLQELGDGQVRITALDEIAAVAVSATVPHAPRTVPLMVTVAQLSDGTRTLDDADVVWPRPGRDEAASLADPDLPFQHDDGVGPWTWPQLKAILQQPATGADGAPEGRRPIVVRGTRYAVGDLVTSTGDSSVLGEVVAVDTAEVDGTALQLLTIELRSPALLFDEVAVDLGTDDLAEIGVVRSFTMPEEVTAPPLSDGSGPRRRADRATTMPRPSATADPAAAGDEDPAVGQCKASVTGNLAELKHTVVPSIDVVFDADLSVTSRSLFNKDVMFQFQAGVQGTITGGIEAKAMFNATGTLTCGLMDIPTFNLPAPAPVGPFLTIESTPRIFGTFEIAAQGGPSYTYKSTCTAAFKMIIGFRFNTLGDERYKNLSDFDRKTECSSGGTFDTSINGFGAPSVSGSATIGIQATGPADLRIGGALTREMAEFFDDPNLGLMKMISLEIQPKAKMSWANTAYVVGNKETPALAQVDIGIKGLLQSEPVTWIIEKLATSVEIEPAIFEMEIPIAQAYRGINAAASPTLEVNGDTVTNGVQVGDRLDLTAETGTGTKRAPISADFDVDAVRAYAKDDNGSYQEIDGFVLDQVDQPSAADKGPTIKGHLPITDEVCQQLGSKDREVVVLTTGEMLTIDTRGMAAAFTLRCAEPELSWLPDSVVFEPPATKDAAGRTQTVRLQVADAPDGAEPWTYAIEESADWLTVEGSSGNTMRPRILEVDGTSREGVADDVKLTIDCGVLGDGVKTATVTATIETPDLPDELRDVLEVKGDCRERWTTLSPSGLVEPGGAVTITHSDGQEGVAWSIGGGGATYEPSSGTFPAGEGTVTVSVSFANPAPNCPGVTPAKQTLGSLSSAHADDQQVELNYTEKRSDPPCQPPPPCTDNCGGPAGAWGDPHLTTLDGLRYDAQVLGEYRYLVPDPLDPDAQGPVLHVSHQLYGSRATTVEAVALAWNGHRVEVYGNPWKVIVDGEERGGALLEQIDGLTITTSPEGIQLTADGASYLISRRSSYLDLSVQTRPRAPLAGLLGSPDGIPGNDLRLRDGSDTITEQQARMHGDDFYRFAESWRVTDPDESLFTIPSPAFGSTVRIFDWSTVEPYVAQVQAMFESLGPVCSGLDAGTTEYEVRMLALELAAGTSLADTATLACRYAIRGSVSAAGDDFSPSLVGGATIEITAPGFLPCTAVAATSGYYACDVRPDLDALAAGDVPGGVPTFHLRASRPDTDVVVEADVTASRKAPLSGSTTVRQDLSFPIDGTSSLALTGRLTRGPVPLDLPVVFLVTEYDGTGTWLRQGTRTVTGDPATGAYELRRMFDPSTRRAEIQARVSGTPEVTTRSVEVPGTGPVPFTFDLDHNPPIVTLSGRLEGADHAQLQLEASRDGVILRRWTAPVTAVDGRYAITTAAPVGSDRLVVTGAVGPHPADHPTVTFTDLTPGPNDRPFDLVVVPVRVTVSGTMHIGGAPPTGPVPIQITGTDGSGAQTFRSGVNATADPTTGAYTVTVSLPQATRSVTVVAQPGSSSTTWATASGPVEPGDNQLRLDLGVARPTVAITGRLLVDGAAPAGPVPLAITMKDGAGSTLQSVSRTVAPGADGRFDLTPPLELPLGTTELQIQVRFPGSSTDWRTATYPLTTGHTELSVDHTVTRRAVTVSGLATSWGEPVPGATVNAAWRVGGSIVHTEPVTVTPGPDGRFQLDLRAPTGATELVLGRFGPGPSGTDAFPLVSDGPTALDWDLRPPQLSLSGTRMVDGAPAGPATMTGTLVARAGGSVLVRLPDVALDVDAFGTFGFASTLPGVGRDPGDPELTWQLEVPLARGTTATVDLGRLPRGVTERSIEIDDSIPLVTGRPVEVHAWIAPGAQTYWVTPIVWDNGSHRWEELDPFEMQLERPDGPSGGRGILRAHLPEEATWFRIEGPASIVRSFPVDADEDITVVRDVSFQPTDTSVAVSGQLQGHSWCFGGTFVFDIEVSWFTEGDDGTVTGTLDTFTVFPETDGTFSLSLPVIAQPGVTGYRFRFTAHPDYSPFVVLYETWRSIDASELGWTTIELFDTGSCAI